MTSHTVQVAKKELREMFRDKRVRSSAIFGPIMLIVILFSLMGFVFGQLGKKENTKVHVVKTTNPLLDVLKKEKFQIIEVADKAKGEAMIRDGSAKVLLAFPPAGSAELIDAPQVIVDAYVDPKQQPGQIALAMINSAFEGENKKRALGTLKAANIPETALEPIKVDRHEITVGQKAGASEFLVGMLPYFIVIWAFYGAMSIAGDLVAGEKEKNTLETLLITPTRRTSIVLGKFLALSVVSLISSLSSLVGVVIIAVVKPPGSAEMFKTGLGVSPTAFLFTLMLMLPMVALFSSLLIGVSSYAKNSREAQTYLTQISFVVIMPAIFSQFIGWTDYANAAWVNAIPILNTANNIRMVLLGKPDFVGMAITMGISIVLAAIALKVTVGLFNREEVLVRV